ncbi:putative membrane protein [Pullulanibacillus pueri]|uniref:DUF4190 domain-containing protein n=1 Tax=Pullulanibacillus pueri TaxID=1437324 RepID=A0A8J3A097_9BACL|nr:DUF4190 domain-containing protein [Pullulanibacillus pueri]MBM7684031.1 putative membrane protein [Pullulanibacillus pueri]GGH88513.1 hypothetical protein GCM10007096_41020 [Pullulanibacillus pueri]
MEENFGGHQPRTNGKSIAALVLGICSIVLPWVGLIIGIVGIVLASQSIKTIKQTNENGYGMAVAGLVCSIVGVCIYGIIILLAIIGIAAFSALDTSYY